MTGDDHHFMYSECTEREEEAAKCLQVKVHRLSGEEEK